MARIATNTFFFGGCVRRLRASIDSSGTVTRQCGFEEAPLKKMLPFIFVTLWNLAKFDGSNGELR